MTTSGGCRIAVACLEAVGGHANEHAASALRTMAVLAAEEPNPGLCDNQR